MAAVAWRFLGWHDGTHQRGGAPLAPLFDYLGAAPSRTPPRRAVLRPPQLGADAAAGAAAAAAVIRAASPSPVKSRGGGSGVSASPAAPRRAAPPPPVRGCTVGWWTAGGVALHQWHATVGLT